MRLKLKRTLALLVGCTTILGMSMKAMAANNVTYVDDVQEMYDSVNQFRTSGTAWYYDENNTRQNCGTLAKLIYDKSLEEIAKIRANDLISAYNPDHTRPDGSPFNSVVASDGTNTFGENIARAQGSSDYYGTAGRAFEGFKEEDQKYAGQGHRRNMLGVSVTNPFTSIGIAHVQFYDGEFYYDYWVQEFGYKPLGDQTDDNTDTPPGQTDGNTDTPPSQTDEETSDSDTQNTDKEPLYNAPQESDRELLETAPQKSDRELLETAPQKSDRELLETAPQKSDRELLETAPQESDRELLETAPQKSDGELLETAPQKSDRENIK